MIRKCAVCGRRFQGSPDDDVCPDCECEEELPYYDELAEID